ncbi:DUF421 domain-containing protein [Dyadobacter sp. CY326]|uniref:DUF421 domain-containing protein n=1 Tax=Dyadobacter sp. CY326 TaxID=2907300 RepID=UPI001F38299B|nr:YetF domain-containing protein [Dyadobacter sp. CY326]MCE7066942.1 DUF421 domain-containing protein [Dyadobacter sp. CY326]
MKPDDIKISDWQRIFLGDVPGGFYPEVIFRIVVIYIILMVSMRLMGKRMASQLSRNEMIAMVSLAAAIGVPLQSPDRGVLPAVIIAMVVVLVQQLVAWLSTRNQHLESITQGNISVLVADGVLNYDNMKSTGISRERVFAQLRANDIVQSGEVKRLYFEAGGTFTVIRQLDVPPGLAVLPEFDQEFWRRIYDPYPQSVCKKCGNNGNSDANCENCGGEEWINAVAAKH